MKKNKRKTGIGRWIFVIILSIIMLFTVYMTINANVLHIRRATVQLPDLPKAFDGATILYISDIDLCGMNTAHRVADAFHQLQSLKPDIVILGGDYTSPSLWELLDGKRNEARMITSRRELFSSLSEFYAPMGKFALSTLEDERLGDIAMDLEAGGFVSLNDRRQSILNGSAQLWLAGVDAETDKLTAHAAKFQRNECVICVTDSPDRFPRLMTAEASDSGQWMDLCLSGSTHGGQIRLGDLPLLELSEIQKRYISGWTREAGVPLLVSTGMGCEAANLRLGTQAEVWLIELKCFT